MRSARVIVNALVLATACAVSLLLAECTLRVVGIGYPRFYQPDPERGAAHRPEATGWYRSEGEAWVSINSAGFRDREHERKKAPGVLRIAFLGDSYTEALQVDRDDAFWAVAERELARCPDLDGHVVEALNFGVSGYGTDQALQTLRSAVWDYQPDLVVLAFLTDNDIRNNSRELEKTELKPYFVVREGALELDDAFLESEAWARTQTASWRLKSWFSERFYLVQLVLELRKRRASEAQGQTEDGSENLVYAPPATEAWSQAWEVTERLITTMREEVEKHGASFQLLVLTNSMQVHPDPEVRRRYAKALDVRDLLYPDRRIQEFARERGISVLSLVEAFGAESESREICLHGFENARPCGGHWNEEGHRLAGQLLARQLCRNWAPRVGSRAKGDQSR